MVAVVADPHENQSVLASLDILREFLSRPLDVDQREAVKSAMRELLVDPSPNDKLRGFDLFWELYPKRHGRKVGKMASKTKWAKLELNDKRLAYRALKHYVLYCEQTQTPPRDAERFLANRYWQDFLDDGDPIVPQRPSWIPSHAVADGNGGWQY